MSAEIVQCTSDHAVGSAVQAPVTDLTRYVAADSSPSSHSSCVCSAVEHQQELSSFSASTVITDHCGRSHEHVSDDNLARCAGLGPTTEYVGCFSSDLAVRPTLRKKDSAFDGAISTVALRKKRNRESATKVTCVSMASTASGDTGCADKPIAFPSTAASQDVCFSDDVCASNESSMTSGSSPHISHSLLHGPDVCSRDDAAAPTAETTSTATESVASVSAMMHEASAPAALAGDALADATGKDFSTLSAGTEELAKCPRAIAISNATSVVPSEPLMTSPAPSAATAGAGNTRKTAGATVTSGSDASSQAAALIAEAVPTTKAETTAEILTSVNPWNPYSERLGCDTAQLSASAMPANDCCQPVTMFSFENPLYAEREFMTEFTESRAAGADSFTDLAAGAPGANQLDGNPICRTLCGDQIGITALKHGYEVDGVIGADAFVPQLGRRGSNTYNNLEEHSRPGKVWDENVLCPSPGDAVVRVAEDLSETLQRADADADSKQPCLSAKSRDVTTPSVVQATTPTLSAKAHHESVDDPEDTDDDAGIYDESYRSSKWLFVGKDSDEEVDPSIGEWPKSGSRKADDIQVPDPASVVIEEGSQAVISLARNESGRRGVYRSISCKTVQRHSSLEVFHRENTRIIEPDKTVVLTRRSTAEDFGFNIKGCHPIVVTVVRPGSLADDAGVTIGDVVLAVNYQSVLSLTHEQTEQLIAADSLTLVLELCSKLDGLVTGSVPLLIYAQPVVSPASMVIRSGHLSKITGFLRLWKRFWFVLKPDNCLYYYRTETDKEPLGAIPLSGYTLCRATDLKKDYTVKLVSSCSTYYLAGESESEIMQWAEVLNRACASTSSANDVWLETSAHNVSLPALALRSPDCHGQLTKLGGKMKTWRRRYCVLKDACIYYYVSISSTSAQGVAHLHGYTVDPLPSCTKKNAFNLVPPNPKMRTFSFYADTEFEKDRWVRAMTLSIGRWALVDGQSLRKRSTATFCKSRSAADGDPADPAAPETRQRSCPDEEQWALVESSH